MIVRDIVAKQYADSYSEILYEWGEGENLFTLKVPVYSHLNVFNRHSCKINMEEFLFCADYIYELVMNRGYTLDKALDLVENNPEYYSIDKCVRLMLGLNPLPEPENLCSDYSNIYAYLLLMARAIYDTDKLFGIFFDSTKYDNQVSHNQKLLNMYKALPKDKGVVIPYHKHFSFLNARLKEITAEIKRHYKLLLGKPSTKYSIVKTLPQVKEAFDLLMRTLSVFSDNKNIWEFHHCSFDTESKLNLPNKGTFSKQFFILVDGDKIPVHLNYFNCGGYPSCEGFPLHNKFAFSLSIPKLKLDPNCDQFNINMAKTILFLLALFDKIEGDNSSSSLYYTACFVVSPDIMCKVGEKLLLGLEHAYASLDDLSINDLSKSLK
jgi:hypothetical protein